MTDQRQGSDSSGSSAFREVTAIANFQPIVGPSPLRVRGEYHLNRRSGSVKLEAKVPQGINHTELLLDLIIDGNGTGGDWVTAEESFPAEQGQYKTVRIEDRNGESITVEVEEVH